MAKASTGNGDELYRVQHAVVIQTGEHLRRLNELLAVGWRVQATANMPEGALVIIESAGTEDQINEFRETFSTLGM